MFANLTDFYWTYIYLNANDFLSYFFLYMKEVIYILSPFIIILFLIKKKDE